MARNNVQEIMRQDNGQALQDALELIGRESFSIGEEMSWMANKADLLADIDFRFLSEAGKNGLGCFLREMAKDIREIRDRLYTASTTARENL